MKEIGPSQLDELADAFRGLAGVNQAQRGTRAPRQAPRRAGVGPMLDEVVRVTARHVALVVHREIDDADAGIAQVLPLGEHDRFGSPIAEKELVRDQHSHRSSFELLLRYRSAEPCRSCALLQEAASSEIARPCALSRSGRSRWAGEPAARSVPDGSRDGRSMKGWEQCGDAPTGAFGRAGRLRPGAFL